MLLNTLMSIRSSIGMHFSKYLSYVGRAVGHNSAMIIQVEINRGSEIILVKIR